MLRCYLLGRVGVDEKLITRHCSPCCTQGDYGAVRRRAVLRILYELEHSLDRIQRLDWKIPYLVIRKNEKYNPGSGSCSGISDRNKSQTAVDCSFSQGLPF